MDLNPIILVKSLVTGLVVGVAFSLLKLPIPAPGEVASIVGIIGIFLGMVLVKMFLH
jgi:XapX domain-containing protein